MGHKMASANKAKANPDEVGSLSFFRGNGAATGSSDCLQGALGAGTFMFRTLSPITCIPQVHTWSPEDLIQIWFQANSMLLGK